MSLGSCKGAVSCRRQKTTSHMTCSSAAYGRAVKAQRLWTCVPLSLDHILLEGTAACCHQLPQCYSGESHQPLNLTLTRVRQTRAMFSAWWMAHSAPKCITCACIPALTSPVFVGLVQTRFAQYLQGFLGWWWCRLCVKKDLTCHGSVSRSPGGTCWEPGCQKICLCLRQ